MLRQRFFKSKLALALLIFAHLLLVPQVFADDDDDNDVEPPTNTAPVATPVGPVTTAQNSPVSIVLAGTDEDDDLLTYTVSQPSHGTLVETLGVVGPSVTYTPVTDYFGSDSFFFFVSDGEDDSDPETVRITVTEPVNTAPTVSITASPLSGDAPLEVQFTSTATDTEPGTIASYAWDFGDGGTSTNVSPSHQYTEPGSYAAKLTVTDNDAATATATVQIEVAVAPVPNVAPVASFNSSITNLQVAFTSTSKDDDGTIASYEWDFGDGSAKGTGEVTTHTYAAAGDYRIKLTVTDDGNPALTGTSEVQITVAAAIPPPVAKISVSPGQQVAEGTEVTLDGSGSTGDGSLAYHWIQSSSDRAKVTLKTNGPSDPKAIFTAPKVGLEGTNLEFTLTVRDSNNLQTPATVKIAVDNDPAQNAIPRADAGLGIQADQGTEVTLLGGNSSDEDGDDTIVGYTWTQDPKDVIRVELVNDPATPNATFLAPAVVKELAPNGVYILNFELVVEDNEGARSEPARVVANVVLGVNVLGESKSLPVADAGSDQAVAPGSTVQLDGSASQGQAGATGGTSSIVSYLWASEDLDVIFSNPTLVNPTFTVPGDLQNGSQLVLTLQVTNSDGLIDIDDVVISVGENPPVVEAGEARTVGKDSMVTLTGTASDNGRIESRLWTQVEGIPVTLVDPSSEDGKTTFDAPTFEGDAATLRFEFQATDNENLKSSDVVEITVKEEVEFSGSSGGGLGFWTLIGLGFLFSLRKVE